MHRIVSMAKQHSISHVVGKCERHKEERDVLAGGGDMGIKRRYHGNVWGIRQ